MKRIILQLLIFIFYNLFSLQGQPLREKINFNNDWYFFKGDDMIN